MPVEFQTLNVKAMLIIGGWEKKEGEKREQK